MDLDIFVFGTSDAWDENTLTYNSRPAKTTGELGSVLVEIAPQYYEVDVTSYVQGELGGDGLISFYVDGGVVSPICYIQSDDGDNPPSWYWKQGPHPMLHQQPLISAVPTSGDEPLTVAFDGSGSTDSDGLIISYAWILGMETIVLPLHLAIYIRQTASILQALR